MANSVLPRVNEAMFIELVLFEDLRRDLLTFLGGRSADVRSTAALIAVVAKRCEATPDQLRDAIHLLETEHRAEADDVLLELLFHPEIPDDVLLRFAEQGRFIPVLGHRGGPRELLELLAERHRYPEAITTLALNYYGAPDAPVKPFNEFLRRYDDVEMLEYNVVRRAGELDEKKQEIVRDVFGDHAEPTPGRRRKPRR